MTAQIYNDSLGIAHDSVLIFDRFGNTYDIRDIEIPSTGGALSLINPCTVGIFRLDFTDPTNFGFNDNGFGAIYRNVACQVFSDLSELLVPANDPYTGLAAPTPFVEIDVHANTTNAALGRGSSFYNEQFNNVLWNNNTNRGLLDGEIWKTINNGHNAFTSFNFLVPGNVYHGFVELNFNNVAIYNTNYSIATPPLLFDVYEIILHEALHMLGVTSFITQTGISALAGTNFYTRYDSHLYLNNLNTPLINTTTGCGNQTYTGASLLTGCSITRFISGLTNLPVHAPGTFGQGQSLSHLDGSCSPFTPYVINNGGGGAGSNRRHPTQPEVDVLCALGYHCSNVYGTSSTGFNNFFNYNGTCGSRIAGVDDWFHFNTTTPYVYTQGNFPLLLDDFLLNDEDESSPDNNPQAYECATVIFGGGTIAPVNASSFTYSPQLGFSGWAVIRYIPLDVNARKGNFTYIFIQVKLEAQPDACDTTCNLVIDGCLEQLPIFNAHYFMDNHNLSGIIINNSGNNSPDRFGWDIALTNWAVYPNSVTPPWANLSWGVGCTTATAVSASHNGVPNNFYCGMSGANSNQEAMFFQLQHPLQQGCNYAGSFHASARGNCPTEIEIYVHNGPMTANTNYNLSALDLVATIPITTSAPLWLDYNINFTYNGITAADFLIVKVVDQPIPYAYVFFDDFFLEANYTITANLNHPCTGQSNGSIDLSVGSCGGPFTYLWSNSSTNQDITTLIAGTYTVTVTDNIGCEHSYLYTLIDGACDPMSIIKTASPTTTYAGEPITFNITICNNTLVNVSATLEDIIPANFSINCNGTTNPYSPPLPILLLPGCTTLSYTGCFVEIGNDQCNLAVLNVGCTIYSSQACVDVLVGCPMIVSGFGDCAPGSKLNICYGLHTVVSNVNGFDGIIIYPDFLTPTATLASTSIPISLGVISNVTFTNVGALSTYTDPLNCPGCVYRSMQVQLDYTGPQTFTAWPYSLGCFEFEITGTVPPGHNHFILSCQDPATLVLNNTQLNTQAGPLHYWTQSGHLLLNGCPGMPALPDAGFNIDKLSCTGQVTVTATNTSSTAIHKWEFGDNRTTPVLGANPYMYDYFAPILYSTNGPIIPPIDPALPGVYTITHTVFDQGLFNQSTQTVDLYPTCCPADVMIKSGESSSMYGASIAANTIDIEGVFNIDNHKRCVISRTVSTV